MEKNIQQTISLPTRYISTIDVLGPKDSFLNLIRQDTAVKIAVNKEEEISLYGPVDEVKRIESVLNKLIDIAANHEQMTVNEVGILLNQSKDESGIYEPQDDSLILKYGKKEIHTRTQGQQRYLDSLRKNDITICIGGAGCGKTMVSVCYGLYLLYNKDVDKIVITRPMVNAKGEADLGALPGDLIEKFSLFSLPMVDVFERMLGKERLDEYIDKGKIQMLPLGYMRGVSMYRTYCLADEMQNASITLAKLLATRIGEESKIVACGDPMQQDFSGESGLNYLANSLEGIQGAGIIRMSDSDIVRHPMITKMLKAFDEYDKRR